jgi:glycosyltransferase involved in cell wall biosynthesis
MYSSEFPPDLGGRSTYVYNLSKKLLERGHEITIVARGKRKKTYTEKIDGILVYRVKYIPFYPFPFLIHDYYIHKLFGKIEGDFDVVHVHGSLAPVLRTSLPMVFTSHGTSKKDLDNMKVKSLHFLIVKSLRNELFRIERDTIKAADVVTAVSASCADQIHEYFSESRDISIVYNGVDSNYYVPSNESKEELIVLYTGRLETRKGLVDFVESAKYVCEKYPEVKFILTGKGTIRPYLEKNIEGLGLSDNFYFAGFVDIPTLRNYYQKATIYVLPSYYEALPTTLLEAMSCGLPSVVTDVEGNSDVITNDENGIVVPSRNPDKLGEAIIKLLDDTNLRDKLRKNARNEVLSKYEWNLLIDRFEHIYSSAIKMKNIS